MKPKNPTEITISIEEYKRLVAIEQEMEILKRVASSSKYFNNDDLRHLLGLERKEGVK